MSINILFVDIFESIPTFKHLQSKKKFSHLQDVDGDDVLIDNILYSNVNMNSKNTEINLINQY